MTRRAGQHAQFLLALAVLGAGLLWPLWLVLRGAFRTLDGDSWTLWHVREVVSDPASRVGFLNALAIACCVTAATLLIAAPVATVATRYRFPGKSLLLGLLLVPLVLPPFVGAIGLRHLLGREGSLNAVLTALGIVDHGVDFVARGGFWSVVLMESLSLYPIVYLNLAAALAALDPALEEAARNAGAGWWTRWRRITLPLARPGAFAGAIIVFIWSFTELGTPLMFEFRQVTSVQIFDGLKEMEASRRPFALVAVMLVVSVAIYATGKLFMAGQAHAMSVKAAVRREERPLGWRGTAACWALLGGVILVAGLPHACVLLASLSWPGQWHGTILPASITFDGWRTALSHPLAATSIRNSLLLALGATVAASLLGVMVARLLVRGTIRGRGVLDALVMLPLAVPGLVMAFGFIAMSLEWPFGGVMPASLDRLARLLPDAWSEWVRHAPLRPLADILGADPNPFPLLIAAYAIRRLPFVARSAVAGLQQVGAVLEEAALGLGASRWRMVWRVAMPLTAASLVAGALLAFSFSMLEVSDSLVLAQRERDFPITKAIYALYDRLGDGELIASTMGVWAMALLAVTLLGASRMIGGKMGALFKA